jgi:uncharacterized protein YjbI with pentapeptide repeats
MQETCNIKNCTNKVYIQSKQCILHSKSEYQKVADMSGGDFQEELADYIVEYITNNVEVENVLLVENLKGYLRYGIEKIASDNESIFLDELNKQKIIFEYIIFDNIKSPEDWNYKSILKKLSKIEFNSCEFYENKLELLESECYFNNCVFHANWNLLNYKILKNPDNVLYKNCTFEKQISSSSESDKLILEATQFKDCQFTILHFENTIFKNPIFKNREGHRGKLETLEFYDCIVENKFIFNRHELEYFRLQDTVFKGKFEFKDNRDVDVVIMNTNFEGLVDFYKTNFKDFFAQKSIFNEFSGFEMCSFGNSDFMKAIEFEHVTFLSFINFRDAKFYPGLDMRDTNLKEYPNFLDAYINPKNTDKETFRIIKHSFDKVGNLTEANRYFSYEMNKEKKQTYFWENPEKKFVLWFNYIISNYGQSFLRPLLWIFVLGIIHNLVNNWLDNITIYDIFANYNVNYENMKNLINTINTFAKNIPPFKRFLAEGKEFISLLFLLGYSTLIYHFIVAVKRITKR